MEKHFKMIPANLDKSIMIKEKDQDFHNIQITSIRINPADPTHPVTKTEVKVFRAIDFRKYFECSTEKQIHYLKVMGIDNAKVVHDPNLIVRNETSELIKGPIPFKKITAEEGRENELEYKEAAVFKKKIRKTTRKTIK